LVNDSIPIAIWDVSRFFCDLLVSLDGWISLFESHLHTLCRFFAVVISSTKEDPEDRNRIRTSM
jgi:hypothetical protein